MMHRRMTRFAPAAIALASFTSNANGEFQSPTIAGGAYIVTFTPPADSPYKGAYVTGLVYDTSNSGQWWIALPAK